MRGLAMEMIDRMHAKGLCVYPPEADRDPSVRATEALLAQVVALGGVRLPHLTPGRIPSSSPPPSTPTASSRRPSTWCRRPGVALRLHSWFQSAIVEDGRAAGVIVETKEEPPRRIRARAWSSTPPASLDVAAGARRRLHQRRLHRHHGVAHRGRGHGSGGTLPVRGAGALPPRSNRQARRLIGGCWQYWWLKTPPARCRMVQLPAHDRFRRHEGWRI